ncbi:MAG TPA: hypothetical protein VF705_07945 [Longimicrobium sp.]|jgi:hypothetical protein
MPLTLEENIFVTAGQVALTVRIGEAQKGRSLLELDGQEFFRGLVRDHPIGDGADLVGRTLLVDSVVVDINPNTNRTSVRYELSNAGVIRTFDLQFAVDAPGDTVDYTAVFHFLAGGG